jgi:hypothetical protein
MYYRFSSVASGQAPLSAIRNFDLYHAPLFKADQNKKSEGWRDKVMAAWFLLCYIES